MESISSKKSYGYKIAEYFRQPSRYLLGIKIKNTKRRHVSQTVLFEQKCVEFPFSQKLVSVAKHSLLRGIFPRRRSALLAERFLQCRKFYATKKRFRIINVRRRFILHSKWLYLAFEMALSCIRNGDRKTCMLLIQVFRLVFPCVFYFIPHSYLIPRLCHIPKYLPAGS